MMETLAAVVVSVGIGMVAFSFLPGISFFGSAWLITAGLFSVGVGSICFF